MRHFNKIDWSISLSVLFACVLTVIAACVAPSGPLGAPNNLIQVPTVSSVRITLALATLAPGQTTQATAIAKSADGKVVAGSVDFSSQNPSIATVSSNGLVTALTAGVATIQATVAARVATASVTVQSLASPVAVVAVALDSTSLAIGHAAKATAVAKDAAGSVITGQAVTWASLSPTIATVSSLGAVMAVAPGSATIKGTISGTSGSASVTVQASAPTVVTVAVAIDSSNLGIGHSAQASATPKDAAGTTIVGQTVTWASLTPSVATVSSSGAVTAVAAGSVAIQATVLGVNGSTSIVVVGLPYLVSHNFNDSTIGPYHDNGGTDLDFPDDPTGSGRGRVARFHYLWASSNGTNHDANRSIEYVHPVRFGESIYFKGDLYIPLADLSHSPVIQRKLTYWHPHVSYNKYGANSNGGPVFYALLSAFGTDLKAYHAYVDQNGVLQGDVLHQIATLAGNQWYVVEVQLTMESSIGAGDGIYRVWLDGALIYETTTLHLTDPAWIGQPLHNGNGTPQDLADVYFDRFDVGDQTDSTGNFDEYRYWDNVAFSTTRIGP